HKSISKKKSTMTNLKDISICIDRNSWNPNTPPLSISALSGNRATNIDCALIYTGLWTCPALCFGFSLSDCWAWLRYQRAFATTRDLRLRQEWSDIDPHQKTVLSDELGVGFTTQLFIESLSFLFYVDTKFFIEVIRPSGFALGRTAKHGPSK